MKKLSLALLILATTVKVSAQNDLKYNVVTTAVPILLVSPDSRAGAMGDVGVASTPDANSSAWNPAKLAFLENKKPQWHFPTRLGCQNWYLTLI